MRLLSLFSGCGGMDLGFEGGFKVKSKCVNPVINPDFIERIEGDWVWLAKNEIETVFANDINMVAKKVWCHNFKQYSDADDRYVLKSVVDLVKRFESGERDVFPENIDILTGGFPCQDFSVAGKRRGFNSHKSHSGRILTDEDDVTVENRGFLYFWMKRVIEIVQPKMFIAENVKGLANLEDVRSIIERDFAAAGNEGYFVFPAKVLNAQNYGVPQARERIIFIGMNKQYLKQGVEDVFLEGDCSLAFNPYPVPSHVDENEGCLPLVTTGDVLLDLCEPELSVDLSHFHYSKAKWMGKHCQGNKEINLSKPGPTIRSEHHGNIEFRRLSSNHGGLIHNEIKCGMPERRLSVRECARIQTFPDEFEFVVKGDSRKFFVNASDAYKVVGNAVPPLMAYHIVRNLMKKWNCWFEGE